MIVPDSAREPRLPLPEDAVEPLILDAEPVQACGDPANADQAIEGASRRRVLRVEGFEPSKALSSEDLGAYRRRFSTLLHDEDASKRGGNASVLRVSNLWDETFALKLLLPSEEGFAGGEGAPAQDARESAFRQEYRLHCAVSGLKGFPRVHGFGYVEGMPAIVMEWVEGVTLAKASRILSIDDDGRISPLTAARIGRDLFELVERLDAVRGSIVHRDISLSNVMLRTDRLALLDQVDEGVFDACLVDFGSAASEGVADGALEASRGATLEYAAPELLALRSGDAGSRVTAAADVHAAAGVVWHLVTGQAPYAVAEGAGAEGAGAEGAPDRVREDALRPWRTAHASADIAGALLREPEVAVIVRRESADIVPVPGPIEVAHALNSIDEDMGSVLSSCLSPDPLLRPSAESARDALGSFAFHYAENFGRELRGEPKIPLAPGSLADGYGGAAQRVRTVLRVAGKALASAVGLVVLVATAIMMGGAQEPFSAISGISGAAAGVCAFLALMVPAAGGCAFRWRAKGARGLLRGTAGVILGTAATASLFAVFQPSSDGVWSVLGAALAVSCAAAWMFLAMDFVAPSAKRRRMASNQALSEGSCPSMLPSRTDGNGGGDAPMRKEQR